MIYKAIGFLFLMLLYTNSYSQTIEFEPVLEIEPNELLGTFITDVTMGSDGAIAVALNDLSKVHLYDLKGELISEYGRRGRGPGDFSNLMSVHVSDSIIYAMDAGPGGKINAFDREDPVSFQAFGIPRLNNSFPLRMWALSGEEFVVEYRPSYSNMNLENTIMSTYSVISVENDRLLNEVFQHESAEKFINRSDGGFSISDMPYGRENFVMPIEGEIFHNWSGKKNVTRLNINNADTIDVIEPQFSTEPIPLNDQDYRRYFFRELGISDGDNFNEVIEQLANDPSTRARIRGLQAKLENRDELHHTFPVYEWVVGDSGSLCFGFPDENRSLTRVECTDPNGEIIQSGSIDSSVTVLGLQDQYLYGTRALETGLTSVVVYEMR